MPELSKLAKLRAKTDRDLARIITGELELGIQLAIVAANNNASGQPARLRAEKAYAEALQLVPKANLSESQRQRFEIRLKTLRAALDAIAEPLKLRAGTAGS